MRVTILGAGIAALVLTGTAFAGGRQAPAPTQEPAVTIDQDEAVLEADGAKRKCPDYTIACTAIYAPVICSNGVIYPNLCEATYHGCATGCVPYGNGGPVAALNGDANALSDAEILGLEPEAGGFFRPCRLPDIYCLDVYDPVICSNGVVYGNACYALRACATGCVPYGAVITSDLPAGTDQGQDLSDDEILGGIKRRCPDPRIHCLDVWDPVICPDGNVYSNYCYATNFGCQTNCVPYGGATE